MLYHLRYPKKKHWYYHDFRVNYIFLSHTHYNITQCIILTSIQKVTHMIILTQVHSNSKGTSSKKDMFCCSSWWSSYLAFFGSKGSQSGRTKPCLMQTIFLACRTCFETTGSWMDWYSLRADCIFSGPLFARHLPKTTASKTDTFVLHTAWGVVGWPHLQLIPHCPKIFVPRDH